MQLANPVRSWDRSAQRERCSPVARATRRLRRSFPRRPAGVAWGGDDVLWKRRAL